MSPTTEPASGEYFSKNLGVTVQKVIQVRQIISGELTTGWMLTYGMTELGMPELEMRGVPLFLAPSACTLMNQVCDYMLNTDNKMFKAGQVLQFGMARFRLVKSIPIPGEEEHFARERWMFEDVEHDCAHCKSGKKHKH